MSKSDAPKPLNDAFLRKIKANPKDYGGKKFPDGGGLYFYISPAGGTLWQMAYRFNGKQKTISFGEYPIIGLRDARDYTVDAKRLIYNGVDPLEQKKAVKAAEIAETQNTFEAIARECHDKLKSKWSADHADRKWHYLEKDVFPTFGNTPIKNITPRELLTLLEKIQARGAIDVAHRIKSLCGEVFRYGIYTDRCDRDPTQDLKGVLIPKRNKHMATITSPEKVGELLRAIDGYQGDITTQCALKLAPYVMLRPGEIRHAEWSEISFDRKQWKIPADKMKMSRPHIIPLSNQVIAILKTIERLTGQGNYVFPSRFSKDSPMSENTLNAALRRLGFTKEKMTSHGFRGIASTLLHENGFKSDVIEAQLAHAERNKVKAAYNHAEYLTERTDMMQWWADYLDSLKSKVSNKIVYINY